MLTVHNWQKMFNLQEPATARQIATRLDLKVEDVSAELLSRKYKLVGFTSEKGKVREPVFVSKGIEVNRKRFDAEVLSLLTKSPGLHKTKVFECTTLSRREVDKSLQSLLCSGLIAELPGQIVRYKPKSVTLITTFVNGINPFV